MIRFHFVIALLALLISALLLFSCSDDGGGGEKPDEGECLTDSDCPSGFVCKLKLCKLAIDICVNDNDCLANERCIEQACAPIVGSACQTDDECRLGYLCTNNRCAEVAQADGDEAELDQPTEEDTFIDTDEDATEEETPPLVDGDEGEEDVAEQADEAEAGEDPFCDENTLDPRCSFMSEIYCRNNTVRHSVKICKGADLYLCKLIFDCSYPTCGYVTSELYQTSCTAGCVANANPEEDDYCAEAPPVDGDEDDVEQTDTIEEEEEDDAFVNRNDGYPCQDDDGCLPNHKCLLDWDGDGRYCAPPGNEKCVFHIGIDNDEPAILYDHGDKICWGNTYKRCSSGSWYWQSDFDCPRDECISGYLFWEGQECVNFEGCQPMPREPAVACPGNYACLDDYNCRGTCVVSTECRPGYICEEGQCNENDLGGK